MQMTATCLQLLLKAIADNEHVCKIVWNSNGIDIARLVNTHRTNIDKEGTHSKWDVRAADGTVEKIWFQIFLRISWLS